jgi:FtsH-binding integral membrane protein
MTLALQVIIGLVAAICLLGGLNLLNKGAMAFLPKDHPPALELDNLFRFTSGIYFSMGFLLTWVVATIAQHGTLLYFLGTTVAFAGLGRAWSIAKAGSPGTYHKAMMWLEIGLGMAIIVLQSLRDYA